MHLCKSERSNQHLLLVNAMLNIEEEREVEIAIHEEEVIWEMNQLPNKKTEKC